MRDIFDIPSLENRNPRFTSRMYRLLKADRFLTHVIVGSAEAPYDIHETAKRANIQFDRRKLMGEFALLSVAGSKWQISVSEDVVEDSGAERFLFGHELGHVMLFERAVWAVNNGLKTADYYRELSRQALHHDKIEDFCDYFAEQAELYPNHLRAV